MRLKKVTSNDPIERLAVSVKRSTQQMVETYRDYYRTTYGEEIERSHLVEEILRDFMLQDKGFQKFSAPLKNTDGQSAQSADEAQGQNESVSPSSGQAADGHELHRA
jgi:hypothetical protein